MIEVSKKLQTLTLVLVLFLLCPICGGKIVKTKAMEDEEENAYYGSETDYNLVDWIFTVYMFINHIYYAYKFTDYSLSHIHSITEAKEQKRMERKAQKQMQKQLKKEKKRKYKARKPKHSPTSSSHNKLEKIKEGKEAKASIKRSAALKNYTTASDSNTNRRSRSNYVCCCIRCAPRYFTWQRTASIRLFFRIYTSLSCLLGMVLYMEFFMNLFVEFFITCIVHYKQGYIIALLLLPLMVYVIETLLRLVWHSVYVSWQINCDSNGDYESVESDGKHHFNLEGNRFLFSFKMDEADIEDEYDDVYLTTSDSTETSSDSSSSQASDAAPIEPVTPYSPDTSNLLQPAFKNVESTSVANKSNSDLEVIEEEAGQIVAYKKDKRANSAKKRNKRRSKSDADMHKKPIKKTRSMTESMVVNGTHESTQSEGKEYKAVPIAIDVDYENPKKLVKYKEEKAKQREAKRKQREQLKERIQKDREEARQKRRKRMKEQREMMGDYFLATCWRAWFFIATVSAALVTSYNANVEVAVNGYFWQLMMRYCIIGGLYWSVIYSIFAVTLSFMSRMMSWTLLHPHISRLKFFCLVDAKDHEKKQKTWRNCKICTMSCSVLLFFMCVALGVYLDRVEDDAAGFVMFIGIVWILYYFTNLFMSCKPMGLIALWTDTIPPPGKNYFAHLQVSAQLEDAGQLEHTLNLSNVDSQQVRIGTNTDMELARFNSEKSDSSKHKHSKKKSKRKRKAKVSVDEMSTISSITGVSVYAPTSLRSAQSPDDFQTGRALCLIHRYVKFGYKYKTPEDKRYKNKNGKSPTKCGCRYWYLKMRLFWNNYKNYWLNVYRPFDEYDMETTLESTQILKGFQWLKPCCECRCFKNKSCKCGKCCSNSCAYFMDNTCNICLILLAAFCIGTLFFFVSQFGVYNAKDVLLGSTAIRENSTRTTQYYPICSEYFGVDSNSNESTRSESDLTVLDVLFLSQVVYEMDNFKIDEIIDAYFDKEFEILDAQYEIPFYFHIRHSTDNVDYVAIRGTAGLHEALQDISLYVEIALFEGLQWLVPFLNALPTSFVTAMIYYASLTEQLINADVRAQFDEPIYGYLSSYLDNITTSLHILGHSLGGGISSIVAANLFEDGYDSDITSFGVCSPGALYSSSKFGFGVQALDKTSRALLPRRDLVSKLDVHGGMVQYTDCTEDSMLNCHKMPSVICEVYNNCPKRLARKPEIFDCYCNNLNDLGQQFGFCLNATTCDGDECYVDIAT